MVIVLGIVGEHSWDGGDHFGDGGWPSLESLITIFWRGADQISQQRQFPKLLQVVSNTLRLQPASSVELGNRLLFKNAAERSRQHARFQRRLSSNERTHMRGGRTHSVTDWTNTQMGGTHLQCNPTNGHTKGGRTHNVTQRTDTQIFFEETKRTKPYIEAACCLKTSWGWPVPN